MKEYKLIKDYPGLLEKGCVAVLGLHGLSGESYEVKEPNKNIYRFSKETIENNPEFWEEVVEKDYEILSLFAGKKNIFHKTGEVTWEREKSFNDEGVYLNLHPGGNYGSKELKIYSVKRLSDGEVFTVGDKIKLPIEKVKSVLDIKTYNKELKICYDVGRFISNDKRTGDWFHKIGKITEPLFTTEDGVDMFKGDKYFRVVDFKISVLELRERFSNSHSGAKFFSTKEAAEEYILMNKPCLSLNDIKSCTLIDLNKTKEKLEKLVKSKL